MVIDCFLNELSSWICLLETKKSYCLIYFVASESQFVHTPNPMVFYFVTKTHYCTICLYIRNTHTTHGKIHNTIPSIQQCMEVIIFFVCHVSSDITSSSYHKRSSNNDVYMFFSDFWPSPLPGIVFGFLPPKNEAFF